MTGYKHTVERDKRPEDKVSGPHVPGVDDRQEHIADQDDVDDLLASLGF